jgi:hypothetical protein
LFANQERMEVPHVEKEKEFGEPEKGLMFLPPPAPISTSTVGAQGRKQNMLSS